MVRNQPVDGCVAVDKLPAMQSEHGRPGTRREFIKRSACIFAGYSLSQTLSPADTRQRLLAGTAKRCVTPPLAIPYLKSSGEGTCQPFSGMHDDLFARALVLDNGRHSIALLAVDAIGYDNWILGPGNNFTSALRTKISRKTGLPKEAIMLTTTHAHSTPETIGLSNFRNLPGVAEWIQQHLTDLADTVIAAWNSRVPALVRFGTTHITGIARNRRIMLKNGRMSRYGPLPADTDLAGPPKLDEELSVLRVDTLKGDLLASVLNYTAHPVVTMLLPRISADYPGMASRIIEERFPGSTCLFTQGAAGDVNSIHVSTHFSDALELGRRLGDAAADRIQKLRHDAALEPGSLGYKSVSLHLEPRDGPKLRLARANAATEPTPANLKLLRLAEKLAEGPLVAEIQVMRVGGVKWISLPGEPFVETGLNLKAGGAAFVCGYSNGWIGYFPVRRAYDEGGYEVDIGAWSRVAPGSAEILERKGIELLRNFKSAA